ncbi:CDP-diacylglycerol--glycerol-3-phosphate 3-phosphatidyltransferase [Nocardioides cavernaquae]|uniref:CDP-diacylglycerol--glycerol-3-phosphate 3-phosphatidyltransferase n=1 Tax=Nocardioides cavernaquae TaxID=2321396 RepID=A0A3A5HB23_9ACTN|nr:CDP-diacylglycerol--glycerol-3-phosphate 3-phosphatidyltransferase [Nocardioides cavernaquae]RJS47512.1 CDP-diacylglycerol--glycerol-3-phosphate 3-phosphatidyltransferase [Nocardioides cavernaquae]
MSSDHISSDPAPVTKPSNWNVPNALTTLRIILVPFFGYAMLQDGGDSIGWRITAFVIFTVGMITDKVDGDLARKHNLITDFGKIADPIADKAITGMAFIALSVVGSQSGEAWYVAGGEVWWWVTILVLVREWSVTLLRLSIMKDIVIPAAQLGKIKTTAQGVGLGFLTLPLVADDHAWGTAGEIAFYAAQVVLAIAVALTLWSGYEFFRDAWRQKRAARA